MLSTQRVFDLPLGDATLAAMQDDSFGVLLGDEVFVAHFRNIHRADGVPVFPRYTLGGAGEMPIVALLVGSSPEVLDRSGQMRTLAYAGSTTPVESRESGMVDLVGVSGSSTFGCTVDGGHRTRCWRMRYSSPGAPPALQVTEIAIEGAVAVSAAGPDRACAIDVDGDVWCWGSRGDGAEDSRPLSEAPRRMDLPGAASSVRVSHAHACALLEDGTIWCWGSNAFGQLGDGTLRDSSTAVRALEGPHLESAMRRRHGPYGRAAEDAFDHLP